LLFPKSQFGKALQISLQVTERVLAKDGILQLKVGRKTARSKKLFPLTKLIKKWKRKSFFADFVNEMPKEFLQPRLLPNAC
jgi:hypothetical protein